MKKIKFTFVAIGILLVACTAAPDLSDEADDTNLETGIIKEASALKTDSTIRAIDEKRKQIEKNTGEPLVLLTTNLRAKIKQKWEKIHYYVENGQVVRIKTDPYPLISSRTEEFYLENGKLILVVIKDNGTDEMNRDREEIDKWYYFRQNKAIKEKHSEKEPEYTIRSSDAEELLTELTEYLEIYATHVNQ